MTILKTDPWARINDTFGRGTEIDTTPPECAISHPLIGQKSAEYPYPIQENYYQHIALDIVAETVFDYPYPYITEKSIRAFACKRMFVVLGPPGILSLLHNKGFETFGDFIDESYDSEHNHQKRFFMVVNEIERVCSLPLDELKNYLHSIKPRLEKNFLNLMMLPARELQELKSKLDR